MNQLLHVSASPHIKDRVTTSSIMLDVIIALIPATLFGIIQFKINALLIIVTTITTCVLAEYLYELFYEKNNYLSKIHISSCTQDLFLHLNLPSTVPLWLPVIGGLFAIIVVKQFYGGLGQNFMNPALAARCFLLISFTGRMTNFAFDGMTSSTPLAILKNGESFDLIRMFIGNTAGTIGETSTVALLIGVVYLLIKGVIKLTIPMTYIITFSIFTLLFSPCSFDFYYLACELCGGGLILGAFFMATDYVTSPMDQKRTNNLWSFIRCFNGIISFFLELVQKVFLMQLLFLIYLFR